MSLRDNAIVAYAETKVMEKSDRDVFVLAGEMLEALLDKTGIDKNEIDGLVMAGLTGTGAANPFWAQTTAHRFAGIYTKTDNGICMTKMQVINKKRKKAVQTIKFGGDLCNAGMLMTSIHDNVQKSVERGKDIISVNFYDGRAGYEEDYVFDRKSKKYRLRK